ncbi:MAG TPA: AAA family ATPase, partial [Nitrososphaera sp.]|nr:AAA family ATPase [Nitrososphaera sp.]
MNNIPSGANAVNGPAFNTGTVPVDILTRGDNPSDFADDSRDDAATLDLVITSACDVVPEEMQWLWYPYLPLGKLCLLGGDPGLGKTFAALAMASAYSRGKWPFLTSGKPSETEPGQTLFCGSEDGVADTLTPRLIALGADLRRVKFFEGRRDKKGNVNRVLLDQEPELISACKQCRAKLLIFDPFQRFLPPKAKMNEMETVSPVVSALMRVAQKTGATVLLLGHLN